MNIKFGQARVLDTYWNKKGYTQILNEMMRDMERIIVLTFSDPVLSGQGVRYICDLCLQRWKDQWNEMISNVAVLQSIDKGSFNDEVKKEVVFYYWYMNSKQQKVEFEEIISLCGEGVSI